MKTAAGSYEAGERWPSRTSSLTRVYIQCLSRMHTAMAATKQLELDMHRGLIGLELTVTWLWTLFQVGEAQPRL